MNPAEMKRLEVSSAIDVTNNQHRHSNKIEFPANNENVSIPQNGKIIAIDTPIHEK